jgi:hypothetical protein
MAERHGATPLAGVPVSVAEEHVAAVDPTAAAAINRDIVIFLAVHKI